MKKDSLFVQLMLVIVVVGSLLAGTMGYVISVPLVRTLTEMEERPLHLVSDEIYGIASDSFHELLDERKEDDPEENEMAKQDVLARIAYYKPLVHSASYHFLVADGEGRILADTGRFFGKELPPELVEKTAEGKIRLTDAQGRKLVSYQRSFPAWRWRLLTMIHEDDLRKEMRLVKVWIYGAGVTGFVLTMVLVYTVLKYRIEKPLRTLVEYAHSLMEGRYKTVPELGEGEMGELAAAFNRMTQAIRQREQNLAELAKFPGSNPNLLMKVAPDGTVRYANPSVAAKLAEIGLDPGRPELLLPPETREIVAGMPLVARRKKEMTWKTHDRTIEYTVFGFADEDAVVFHGVDVTEKKRMEEQLFHAHKMEILGRIAGGVAHDFNNLLVGILGYASLLKSRPLPDGQVAKAVDSIEKAAERGTQLVRQLLGFARKGTHEFLPVDMNRIVDETKDIVSQTFAKAIAIRVRKEKDLPAVNGDGTQLQQCLMNLCINARDAMTDGGTLSVTTRAVHLAADRHEKYFRIPAGAYVGVVVDDDGHGMDEATQERIFDPFFTTKGKQKGTGLGMSLVYGIVKNHGGFIMVRSAPGRGTSVEILYPASADRLPLAAPAGPLPAEAEGGRDGSVLLVDDEEFVRDVGRAMLAALGYNVITACDGREGVEIFARERSRLSLTILDLMMPVMDGRKAFEEMRAIDPGAKIVISSGYSGPEDVDTLKRMGASAILPKPYTYAAMANMVNLLVNR